jgi:hypothetical protein
MRTGPGGFGPYGTSPIAWYPPPTPEQLAEALLQDAEFRSLQLGSWLNSTDGQVIAEAVAMVVPPLYRTDFELVVEGLQRAADLQRLAGKERAGQMALAVILAGALAFLTLASLRQQH